MKSHRPTSRSSAALGDIRPERWWLCDSGSAYRFGGGATNRLKLKRTRLHPREAGEAPKWWPKLQAVIVLVSILMPVLTIRYGETWKKSYQQWRASLAAGSAVAEAEAGDPGDVLGTLMPQLAANPNQPELVRKSAWATKELYPRQSQTLFRRLRALDASTLEDDVELGRLIRASGDLAASEAFFALLLDQYPEAAEPWLECGRVAIAQGDRIQARAAFEQALQRDETFTEARLALSVLMAESGRADERGEAIEALLDLAERQLVQGAQEDAVRLVQVFLNLNAATVAQKQRMKGLAARFEAVMPVEVRLACAAMSAPTRLDGDGAVALRQEWVRILARTSNDENTFLDGICWLQAWGAHDVVLDQTDLPNLHRRGSVMVVRLISMLALGKADEAAALASHPQIGGSGIHPLILEALESFRVSPSQVVFHSTLDRLMEAAGDAPEADVPYIIGQLAALVGAGEVAEKGFELTLQRAPHWGFVAQAYLDSVRGNDRPAPEALGRLLGAPLQGIASSELKKRIAYLRLLSGDRVVSTLQQMESLLEVHPGDPYLRMVIALGHHLREQPEQAARMLVPLPQYRWHHGEAAVIAAILMESGEGESPLRMVRDLRPDRMLHEEQQLVAPLLERAQLLGDAEVPVQIPLARNP